MEPVAAGITGSARRRGCETPPKASPAVVAASRSLSRHAMSAPRRVAPARAAASERTQQPDVGVADCRSARCGVRAAWDGFADAGRREREQAPTALSGTAACPRVATLLLSARSRRSGCLLASTSAAPGGCGGVALAMRPMLVAHRAAQRSEAPPGGVSCRSALSDLSAIGGIFPPAATRLTQSPWFLTTPDVPAKPSCVHWSCWSGAGGRPRWSRSFLARIQTRRSIGSRPMSPASAPLGLRRGSRSIDPSRAQRRPS